MVAKRAFGRHSDEIGSRVATKRLALNFRRRRIISRRGCAHDERRFSQNAARDIFRQLVAIRRALCQPCLGRIGEEPALDQNAGNRCATQDVVTTPPNSAVFRWRTSDDIFVDVRGESDTISPIIISLNPVSSRPGRRIKMNADKDRVAIMIGDRDSRRQRNKDVCVTRHDHSVAGGP